MTSAWDHQAHSNSRKCLDLKAFISSLELQPTLLHCDTRGTAGESPLPLGRCPATASQWQPYFPCQPKQLLLAMICLDVTYPGIEMSTLSAPLMPVLWQTMPTCSNMLQKCGLNCAFSHSKCVFAPVGQVSSETLLERQTLGLCLSPAESEFVMWFSSDM